MLLTPSAAYTVSAVPLPAIFRGRPTVPAKPLIWPVRRSGEVLTYAVDLAIQYGGGPPLVSATAFLDPASGLVQSGAGLDGTLALMQLGGGFPGTWVVTVQGTLADGERRIVQVDLPVVADALGVLPAPANGNAAPAGNRLLLDPATGLTLAGPVTGLPLAIPAAAAALSLTGPATGLPLTDPVTGLSLTVPASPGGSGGQTLLDPATGSVLDDPVSGLPIVLPGGPVAPPVATTPPASGPTSFTFVQTAAAAVWVINHDLSKYPQVTVVDTAGNTLEGDITYGSVNQLTLTFSVPIAGTAYLT